MVVTHRAHEANLGLEDETAAFVVHGADSLLELPPLARDYRDGAVDLDALLAVDDSVGVEGGETRECGSRADHLAEDGGVLASA